MLLIFNYKLLLSCYLLLVRQIPKIIQIKEKRKENILLPFQMTCGFVDLGSLTNLYVIAEMRGRETCSLYSA